MLKINANFVTGIMDFQFQKLEPKEEEVHHGSNGHGHHHRKTDECEHVPVLAHFGADSGGAASIGLPHYEGI